MASPAAAIELSLEENRAERGSVGYVDMQRLFSASPDAQRAKDGFQELVRQAEERVNLRKAELLRLRQDYDAALIERAALAASTPVAAVPAPPPGQAPSPVPPEAPAAPPEPPSPTAEPPSPTAEPPGAPDRKRALALPGMSDAGDFTPPSGPEGEPSADAGTVAEPVPAGESLPSDGAPAQPPPPPTAASAPDPASPAAVPAPASDPAAELARKLADLDGRIAGLQADIARKEAELQREHSESDRGLVDVESRRTDQVLARLYRAITEVGRREGVSVVVDKSTILYGHQAVDLTEKVLRHLREAPRP